MPINIGNCPVPFPHLGNSSFCGLMTLAPKEVCRLTQDPWVRLYHTHTENWVMKKTPNPLAPDDTLDLGLSACYDNHRQWWVHNSAIKMQCNTYRKFPFGRRQEILCRGPLNPCCAPCPDSSQPQFGVCHEPYHNDSSHVEVNIGGHHISNTNRGYGRSDGGRFYNYYG